jgi:hypothetical protein
MTTILHTFTNSENGISSFVFESHFGGFGVSLRDDDAGEFVGASIHGFKTVDAAIAKAKEII